MRVVLAAAAVLLVGLPASVAAADPTARSGVSSQSAAPVSDAEFQQATRAFEVRMQGLVSELADPRSQGEARSIAARYQPEADTLAAMIEARRAAGASVRGPFSNPRAVRALPTTIRRNIDDRRRAERFAPPRRIELTPEMYASVGLSPTPPAVRF